MNVGVNVFFEMLGGFLSPYLNVVGMLVFSPNKNKECGLVDTRTGIQQIFFQYQNHPQLVVDLSLKYQTHPEPAKLPAAGGFLRVGLSRFAGWWVILSSLHFHLNQIQLSLFEFFTYIKNKIKDS